MKSGFQNGFPEAIKVSIMDKETLVIEERGIEDIDEDGTLIAEYRLASVGHVEVKRQFVMDKEAKK